MSEEKRLDRVDLLELQTLQLKKQLLEKDKELMDLKKTLVDYDSKTLLANITKKYSIDTDKNYISVDATKGIVMIKEKTLPLTET